MQLLTIGIPVYNCEDLIRNTLQNVFEEIKNTNEPVEILICNNASTDNTEKEILKAIQEIKPNVKELSEKIIIRDGNTLVYHKNTENIGDAIGFFYRALDLYAGMLKGGLNFEYYNILKVKFLNSVLNPKTQKSENFLTNIKYAIKFFKFYFPKLKKWYKFSKVLIFSKKKDFFPILKKDNCNVTASFYLYSDL